MSLIFTSVSKNRSNLFQSQAGGLDRPGPLGDFAADKPGEISRCSPLVSDEINAVFLEAFLRRRIVHGRDSGVVQPLDDKGGRVLGQEECATVGCLEISQSLLMRRCQIWQVR